jgi:hypothetical protein
MYIEEKIEITKAESGTVGQVNGQVIYGHGYSFYQTIIDKKLSYSGAITHQRLDDVALVEDYEHCDTEGGPAIFVYGDDEVDGIPDEIHVAKITIDGITQYYDEPGCWQISDDQCEYVPTGDRDAAPAEGEKEDK